MLRNILFMVLIVSGCTFKKSALKNQIEEGHEELYSEPSEPKSVALNEGEERIVIASTNDLRGRLSPVEEKYGIRLGGRDVLSQYLKILRGHHKEIVSKSNLA